MRVWAKRYRCQYQPPCAARLLARVLARSLTILRVRSATCQGKICTPPETLTIQLRPAFTKLACDGTVRGAGILVERLLAHQVRRCEAGSFEQAFLRQQCADDGQVHHVAQLAEARIFAGQLVELLGERVGPFLRRRVGLGRCAASGRRR